jgi:FtsP/CotA-like multicopper oxidase with cupredoxin domain
MNRQAFNLNGYLVPTPLRSPPFDGDGPPYNYNTPNTDGAIGGNPAVSGFLGANPIQAPLPQEAGWKDTVIMYPGQVTRIVVRWAPMDLAINVPAANAYFPFNPNGDHGYVWHCHIIDHEDNEMMRPTQVQANPAATRTLIQGTHY